MEEKGPGMAKESILLLVRQGMKAALMKF